MTSRQFTKVYNDWKLKENPNRKRLYITTKFTGKPSSKLEKMIVAFAEMHEGMGGMKHEVSGVMRNGRWTTTGASKGVSDTQIVYCGRAFFIEVKIKGDRQREDQKKFQKRVEEAGAKYYIVKSWADFYKQVVPDLAKVKPLKIS